jgi:predicted porin
MSAPAMAQSNVSISGVVDQGVRHTSLASGGSLTEVSKNWDNRLAFTGTEDMGGGLKAFFGLEMGFSANNGALNNNLAFDRYSRVGLTGSFGEFFLGRFYSPAHVAGAMADPWGVEGPAGNFKYVNANAFANDNLGGVRMSNSVQYVLPTMAGFTLWLAASPSQGGATTGVHSSRTSGSLKYSSGPITVTTAYDRADADNRFWLVNGLYDFRAFDVRLHYSASKLAGFSGSSWFAASNIPATASTVLMVGYGKYDDKSPANADSSKFTVGAKYYMSKRTNLYLNLGSESINGMPHRQNMSEVGITHFF